MRTFPSSIHRTPRNRRERVEQGDAFQGKGLGTILLAKLALMATKNGFSWFEATVMPENDAMLEVFRDSGFEVRSIKERGTGSVIQESRL